MHSNRWGQSGLFLAFLVIGILFFGIASIAFAQPKVKVNGYEINVKGKAPAIPKDLEPVADGKYKKWIVQFTGPIHKDQKKQLTDRGCRIGELVFVGGVAMNVGVTDSLKKHLGAHLLVPERPKIVTAMGAAIIAQRGLD